MNRQSLLIICLAAPMYFVARLLLVLALTHVVNRAWLHMTLLTLLIETLLLVVYMCIDLFISAKIRHRRLKAGTKQHSE